MKQILKPECSYFTNGVLTMHDIENAFVRKTALTAKVSSIDAELRKVYLRMGNGLIAEMDWEEATICPLKVAEDNEIGIPEQIKAINKKKVRVLVKDIASNGIVTVSRRDNMKKAWEVICNTPDSAILDAAVVGIHKYGTVVYYDIGDGITGFCHLYNFNSTKVELRKWIRNGEIHQVKKSGQPDLKNFSFDCSRKDACSKSYADFQKYDILDVKVASPICEIDKTTGELTRTAYYVEVNPLVIGIAEVPFIPREIEYGETVKAAVRKIDVAKRKMWLAIL